MVLVDACESGTLAQRKGGRAAPGAYAVSLGAAPAARPGGHLLQRPGESSEEWDSLKGSLFTHHLLTGLRGDADVEADGKVSLAEAYAYAYRRTVAGAAGAGQHPAYSLELTGTGELILTEPRGAQRARLPRAARPGATWCPASLGPDVVAEVEKQLRAGPCDRRSLPGRYLLRKRVGASTGLLEVELPFGGERQVREEDLVWRRYTEVAFKGGSWSCTARRCWRWRGWRAVR